MDKVQHLIQYLFPSPMTHVYEACVKGNLQEVRKCLDDRNTNREELLSMKFTWNEKLTLLHAAAKNGHCEIVQLLLDYGADINAITNFAGNFTPLHLAVYSKNQECIKILLDHPNIDVFAVDNYLNETAYQRSVHLLSKNSDIAKMIKTAEILQASRKRTSDQLGKILKHVHDGKIPVLDDCFTKALHEAISIHPSPEVVLCILSQVAKLEKCRNVSFITCIQKCFQCENFDVEITAQLILCWMAVENHWKQLEYFLGIHDVWQPSALLPNYIQEMREYLKKLRCKDIKHAINMAINCDHTRTAQLLLAHGSSSRNEKIYDVDWSDMALKSLPCTILHNMCSHRHLTGKVLEFNSISRIDLRSNNLTQVPPKIFNLPRLSNLLLSNNKLKELPDLKEISKSLNHLYLSKNRLKQLPAGFSFSKIRTLKLDGNCFTDFPPCICNLPELETLDIHNNQIVLLPLELGLLLKLSVFISDQEKIEYPHGCKEYLVDSKKLTKWLQSLLLNTQPFHTIKLFVIGWQDKGKSTLVRRLKNDLKFFEREITKGVDVTELGLQRKVLNILPKGIKISYQVWDFAGQKDFLLMHMCFLSSFGLYLLVWNLMDGVAGIQELKLWLNNISCETQEKTAVIIVGTHLDEVQDKYQNVKVYIDYMRKLIDDMSKRRQDNVHVVGIVEISSHPENIQGIAELKEKILKASEDIGIEKGFGLLKDPVPLSFHLMVNKVKELRSTMYKNKELPIVNHDILKSLLQASKCSKEFEGRHFEKHFAEAVEFLKARGIILHFDDPSQDLHDVYFIDPKWLFSLMNHVISNKKTDDGLIRKDELFPSDFEDMTFTDDYVTRGVRLLSRFHLIHALNDEYLLMPSSFPEDKSVNKFLDNVKTTPLRRIYRMEHVPPGFFSRLLARLLHFLETMILEAIGVQQQIGDVSATPDQTPKKISIFSVFQLKENQQLQWWDRGLQLSYGEITVVVELIEEKKADLKISCLPSEPGKKMLVFIVEHVEAMFSEWFHGMKIDTVSKRIPCIVCEQKCLDDSHFFTLKECLELSKKAEQVLNCPKHDETVPLSDIAPDISLHDVHENLVLDSKQLHYDETSVINEGSFGKVYHALLILSCKSQSRTVAVKQFKGDEQLSYRELRKEINILRRISHPNIIEMIGVNKPRCIVFELAPCGSLHSILFNEPFQDIPRIVTVYMALEIVDALGCLHRSRIIHRDLKPANVLVFSLEENASVHVKLADFGTANFAGLSGMRAPVVPMCIRAPEVLRFALKEDYGKEVDIYSFAMLLFSLVSRTLAFKDLLSNEIKSTVLDLKRPIWRSANDAMSKFSNLTRLMCVAWSQNPADRPSAEECKEQLQIPEFQALMSKIAFPEKDNVLFVQLSSKEEMGVVYQTNSLTVLSVFSAKFDSKEIIQSQFVTSSEDIDLQMHICSLRDKIVFLFQEFESEQGMFKIYTISNISNPISVKVSLASSVYDIAISTKHIFIALETTCKFGYLDDVQVEGKTMEMHDLVVLDTRSKMVASSNRLWIQREKSIEMYTIEDDTRKEPSILPFEAGVQQLRCIDDTIWVLTMEGFTKVNEQGEIIKRVHCDDFQTLSPPQLMCFVPTHDTIWLGVDNEGQELWILSLDNGNLLRHFPAYNVKQLLFNDVVPPMVISCNRLTKNSYLSKVISPLAIDSSELVSHPQKHVHRKLSKAIHFEENWNTVDDECADVLIAWEALSRDSWNHH